MTSPAQPGIGDAYKLHHVMGHDPIAWQRDPDVVVPVANLLTGG